MKTPTPKQKTPTKPNARSLSLSEQSPLFVHQGSLKILHEQTPQQITRYLIENKLTSFALKNEKCMNILNLSRQIFGAMLVDGEASEGFLGRVIGLYKGNGKKVYEFVRCLKHFAQRDYEFQYIETVAKSKNQESISFYMKCKAAIQESFLNKAKKQLLSSIIGQSEQWFKIVQKIFKSVQKQHLIQLFTDTIKHHYLQIKKNQNELLNGAEIYRICQIISRNIREGSNSQLYSFDERDEIHMIRNQRDERDGEFTGRSKEKQVKRLFEKNVVDGLESEDRELIRILSYKDNNIARLLQKKHEKMIELIADDVETMRRSIEEEKKKYIELWNQKEQILRAADHINYVALCYVANDSVENQEKLFKAIEGFNGRYKGNAETNAQIKKIKESKKNRRLIELIQKEQLQKC